MKETNAYDVSIKEWWDPIEAKYKKHIQTMSPQFSLDLVQVYCETSIVDERVLLADRLLFRLGRELYWLFFLFF
jgi:hypothetical protein